VNETELKARTKAFALRVMKAFDALNKSEKGRVIGRQMLRSATWVAANYRSACRSRSKAEFISKLGVVEEEADETSLWLELSIEGGLVSPKRLESLLQESNELTAIVASSRITAQRNRKSTIGNRK